jgi:membrane protein implicated in regulation of membrane protease activity
MHCVSSWVWWVLAAVGLGVAEAGITTLVFAMFAGGAAAAAALAAAGVGVTVQAIVFLVVTAALLGLVRPVARRHLASGPQVRTGIAALVGKQALVLEQVDGRGGRVKIGGEVWSARSYDGESVIEAGRTVDVLQIEGATALVM